MDVGTRARPSSRGACPSRVDRRRPIPATGSTTTFWRWATQNPPEVGVHWYSNLEIALRSIVLTEVGGRIGRISCRTARQQLWTEQLWHSGRHLVADLPYTLSTMRNNHLMGDALGLQVIGRDFPDRATAKRWALIGERLFEQQAARHFRRDGSMVEDSLSYHRFVLEMLAIHALVEPHVEAHPALVASAQMLARLGALDGPVPQYGDWDEGRVLVSTQTPSGRGWLGQGRAVDRRDRRPAGLAGGA